MSEYQYYEFRAIDKPLDAKAMAALRRITSRAEITPTSLINEYHWGDFKGDPDRLMVQYFDAFLYFANWGTHQLMMRVPCDAIDVKAVKEYAVPHRVAVRTAGKNVILDFQSPDDCYEEEWREWALGSLLPLRADLMAGDLRCLYLAWLSAVQYEDLDDDEPEPPVPSGLQKLSGPLSEFADFMYLDHDLIETAAGVSGPAPKGPVEADQTAWIAALPEAEKNDILVRVAKGEGARLGAKLLARFRREHTHPAGGVVAHASRSAGELRQLYETEREVRMRRREQQAARAKERAERKQALQRVKHLDSLAGKEEKLWSEVDQLVATKQTDNYKQAVKLLKDLFDLARRGTDDTFSERFREMRARHSSKSALLRQLKAAGFRT